MSAATGQMDAAIVALDEALREHDIAPFPFDRARTQLVIGRVRRRRRERSCISSTSRTDKRFRPSRGFISDCGTWALRRPVQICRMLAIIINYPKASNVVHGQGGFYSWGKHDAAAVSEITEATERRR